MKLVIIAAILLLGTVSMLLAQSCGNCICGDNCYNCTRGYHCCKFSIEDLELECCGCCSNNSPSCHPATIDFKHPNALWRRPSSHRDS